MAAWSRRWLPVIAYMAAIFALSSRSTLPSSVAHIWDKLLHAAAYAPLAWLCVRALTHGFVRPLDGGLAATAWLLSVGYGLSDEWHQSFVPNRVFDLGDLAADATGAGVVIGVCLLGLGSPPHSNRRRRGAARDRVHRAVEPRRRRDRRRAL